MTAAPADLSADAAIELDDSSFHAVEGEGFELEARTGLVSVLSGGTIPVADVIRMAADMRVVPIVYGHTGEVLHCGRDRRLFPTAVRHAAAAQDRGCVIPGCETPLPLCQLHHIISFADGGTTAI